MNEKNNTDLVPRLHGAMEKAQPGAKRVLALMVSETLAIAQTELMPVTTSPTKEELETWYQQGKRHYSGKGVPRNFSEAAKWYRKAAEQGHAEAQRELGDLYYWAQGVPVSISEAAKWYRKAAEQGHTEAQWKLGLIGRLGIMNEVEVVKWFHKAAEQGHDMAQCRLGECYSKGEGVPKDDVEAAKWWRKAAEQGHVEAQLHLAAHYVDSDKFEHVKWMRKAAEQGNQNAQSRLSIINWLGGYLPEDQRDMVEAYKWERVRWGAESTETLEDMKKHMSPEDIQKGETLAREFLAKTSPQSER